MAAGKHVLSEKPIADNLKRAQKLVEYYKSNNVKKGATWGVAENFRFLQAVDYAREEILKLGKLQSFSLQSLGLTKAQGNKYYGEKSFHSFEYQIVNGWIQIPNGARSQGTRVDSYLMEVFIKSPL